MKKKKDLLTALNKGLDLEEDFIVRLGPYCRAYIASSELSQAEKKEAETILSVLESDSAKHKRVVEGLIKDLETGEKDGHQEDTI
ncbi:hypothetical protein E3J84_00855 [Candidatus Aerophobetes bacterium]|uniref:Uncharacterized protein n=1 Tax=Aerophobetes bacterium TaxID=2030807 RepID=A0A523RTX2_UNCAE|nr:MAG: hypothetical protein E3J84_05360 [Candidatus Aerophobetes bacterium]TET12863.1 MAG: hypothetical protein E3J84_00855 [Candidatus Aerophobetes bacterium]